MDLHVRAAVGAAALAHAVQLTSGSDPERLNEHFGNLITCFRVKGMVPPSSKRQ